jgi:hypothetical protein
MIGSYLPFDSLSKNITRKAAIATLLKFRCGAEGVRSLSDLDMRGDTPGIRLSVDAGDAA